VQTRKPLVIALIVAIAASACSGGDGMTPSTGGDTVVVSASAGTTPMYSWTGPLAVSVNVARASAPTVWVWGVASPMTRDIASGVTQGVVPPGATETATTERVLTAGVKYRAVVALIDGTSGSVDFTP
jgi:hypothetical protein